MTKHSTLNPLQQNVTRSKTPSSSSGDEELPDEWILHEMLDNLVKEPPVGFMNKFMKRIRLIMHPSEN